ANGNWMVAEVYDPRPDMVGYQLQAFEYEQLDDSVTSHNGRDVVEGVEVDEYGKAVAYHVQLSGHPLDDLVWPTNSIRIKRERVIHLMDPERIKQPLGLTLMHAVLSDLRQFQMYREFEMLAAKYQACFGGIIIDDASQGNTFNPGIANPVEPGSSDDAEDSKGNPELNLEPGMFPRVRGAQDVKFLAPTKPGNMYAPFSQQTIGQVAAGLDADIHSLSRDYTGATYVGLRMAKGDMYDAMDPWQVIMIDLFCRRVWRRFQSYAIREGRYGGLAPNWGRDLEWDEAYLQADWQPPPKRDVDEAKAAMGRKVDLEQGVRTLQIIANQMGADWRDLIEDRGAVQELADRFNVVLPFLDPNAKANPGEPKPRGESPKPAQPEDN
ncbi:MAG: phage portal protein, partial [Planctomycetota bacterium]